MRKKNFLLFATLLLLGFELLEVVGMVALLLLQEGYHHHGLFSTLVQLLKVLLQCSTPLYISNTWFGGGDPIITTLGNATLLWMLLVDGKYW